MPILICRNCNNGSNVAALSHCRHCRDRLTSTPQAPFSGTSLGKRTQGTQADMDKTQKKPRYSDIVVGSVNAAMNNFYREESILWAKESKKEKKLGQAQHLDYENRDAKKQLRLALCQRQISHLRNIVNHIFTWCPQANEMFSEDYIETRVLHDQLFAEQVEKEQRMDADVDAKIQALLEEVYDN